MSSKNQDQVTTNVVIVTKLFTLMELELSYTSRFQHLLKEVKEDSLMLPGRWTRRVEHGRAKTEG